MEAVVWLLLAVAVAVVLVVVTFIQRQFTNKSNKTLLLLLLAVPAALARVMIDHLPPQMVKRLQQVRL